MRAGKSTALSMLAGLLRRSQGSVVYAPTASTKPSTSVPRGTLGIVPQKNVLFPELTCYQTLQLWSAIKRPVGASVENISALLHDCDLKHKIHSNANNLSGGQKRKLQLAIGLIGGSESESSSRFIFRSLSPRYQSFLWMRSVLLFL